MCVLGVDVCVRVCVGVVADGMCCTGDGCRCGCRDDAGVSVCLLVVHQPGHECKGVCV